MSQSYAGNDSVIIESAVALISRAREATGQEPIYDMPKGGHGARACPVAKGLNIGCSVTSDNISFQRREDAEAVSKALGYELVGSYSIKLPYGSPLGTFVKRFDGYSSKMKVFDKAF